MNNLENVSVESSKETMVNFGHAKPLINLDTLAKLAALEDESDPTLMNDLLELFVSTAPGHMTRIRQAAGSSQLSDLRKAAHAFKSGCGTVGLESLHAALDEIEQQVDATLEHITSSLEELNQVYAASMEVLLSYKNSRR